MGDRGAPALAAGKRLPSLGVRQNGMLFGTFVAAGNRKPLPFSRISRLRRQGRVNKID